MLIYARDLNALISLRWYAFWLGNDKNLYSSVWKLSQKALAQETWIKKTLISQITRRQFTRTWFQKAGSNNNNNKNFVPEPPVTAREDPPPFYSLWRHQF